MFSTHLLLAAAAQLLWITSLPRAADAVEARNTVRGAHASAAGGWAGIETQCHTTGK